MNIEKNYIDTLVVCLNNRMLNLDKKVIVKYDGREIFKGKLKRSLPVI